MKEPMNEVEARKRSTLAIESIANSLLFLVDVIHVTARGILDVVIHRDQKE